MTEAFTQTRSLEHRHPWPVPVTPLEGHPAVTIGEEVLHPVDGVVIVSREDRIPVGTKRVEALAVHVAKPVVDGSPWLHERVGELHGKVILASGHNIDPSVQTGVEVNGQLGFMGVLARLGRTIIAPVHATTSKWRKGDFGGHNKTNKPDSIDSGAGSVIASLDAYLEGGEMADLVGHSLGGLEVLDAAAQRGRQVKSVTLISPPLGVREMGSVDLDSESRVPPLLWGRMRGRMELFGRANRIVQNERHRLANVGRAMGHTPESGQSPPVRGRVEQDEDGVSIVRYDVADGSRSRRQPRDEIDLDPSTRSAKVTGVEGTSSARLKRLASYGRALLTSGREIVGGQSWFPRRVRRSLMQEMGDIGQSVDAGSSFFSLWAVARQGIPIKILLPPGPRGGTNPKLHDDALRGDEFFDGNGVIDTAIAVNRLIDDTNKDILRVAAAKRDFSPQLIPNIEWEVVAPEPHHLGGGHNFILGGEKDGMAGVGAEAVDRSIRGMSTRRVTPYGSSDERGRPQDEPDEELRSQIQRGMDEADRRGQPFAGDTSGVYGSQDPSSPYHPIARRLARQSRRGRHRG